MNLYIVKIESICINNKHAQNSKLILKKNYLNMIISSTANINLWPVVIVSWLSSIPLLWSQNLPPPHVFLSPIFDDITTAYHPPVLWTYMMKDIPNCQLNVLCVEQQQLPCCPRVAITLVKNRVARLAFSRPNLTNLAFFKQLALKFLNIY